jgi:hypothetical protein
MFVAADDDTEGQEQELSPIKIHDQEQSISRWGLGGVWPRTAATSSGPPMSQELAGTAKARADD